ncbi:DUF6271 family protein [Vibrio cionasavignyae]|uniref:DUF6271 family protein n=1 Tax=Vibrio cionasavignyae TaxID=2910252 RepID=UPI003D12E9D1
MKKICLFLPTNRECANAIGLMIKEAKYAVDNFNVLVHVLILDTSSGDEYKSNLDAVKQYDHVNKVSVSYFDDERQKSFIRNVINDAKQHDVMARLLAIMLPEGCSYGACTNRGFLISTAFGCDSIHRRDSDSRLQRVNGEYIFPIYQELRSLSQNAHDVSGNVDYVTLLPEQEQMPVSLVGGAFIGAMSVDVQEMQSINSDVYETIVSLDVPDSYSEAQRKEFVEKSFKGNGIKRFNGDRSSLCSVDPYAVDMCNVSFYKVHQKIPLPPAKSTIASDYFLIHMINSSKLPGVEHNRHIDNYHTPERKTDDGFFDYQIRLVKYYVSLNYFGFIFSRLDELGLELLDHDYQVNSEVVLAVIEESLKLDQETAKKTLNIIIKEYAKLGGRYEKLSCMISARFSELLSEAKADMEDFRFLTGVWSSLINSSKKQVSI